MKKIIFIFSLLFLISCTNTNYEKIIMDGYKKYKKDKTYEIRSPKKKWFRKMTDEEKQEAIYFKKKPFYIFWENQMFFVVKEDYYKEEDTFLFLCIKYRGRDWQYMNKVEFSNGEKSYLLDFTYEKYGKPLWKDNMTWSTGVEEYISFELQEEVINEIIPILEAGNVSIKLYSDYDDRTKERKLKEKEIKTMIDMYNFYLIRKEILLNKLRIAKEERILNYKTKKDEKENKNE